MSATLLSVRVARKWAETAQICGLELVDAYGAALPAFSAGAHIDVYPPSGPVRQYSLCNDPAETHRYEIGVLRDAASRGGSAALHDRVAEGQLLTISTPRNHFPLDEAASHSLLLAGGIGVTPLLCMAERLARLGASFELHHCVRNADSAAYRARRAAAPYGQRTHLHCDDGAPAQRLQIDVLLARVPAGTHLYVCGPQGFMDALLGAARRAQWPEERLHCEYFSAAPVALPASGERSFEVQIASTGQVLQVPADRSVLHVLARAGIDIEVSCEQGVCGTCLTRVLDGTPDHRDMMLSKAERAANDQFLPCCSRSLSARLVLDL